LTSRAILPEHTQKFQENWNWEENGGIQSSAALFLILLVLAANQEV